MDESTFVHLFSSYWWLCFPLFWMIAGVVGTISHYRHRTDVLRLIKSYADQGKDPPAGLLDALKSDEQRAYDHADGYYGRKRWRRRRGWWPQVVVFASLAAGFGYFGYYGGGPHVFVALAMGFGVAATCLGVLGLIFLVTGQSSYERDYRDDPKD